MADDDFQTNDNTQADDTASQQPLTNDPAQPFADPDDVDDNQDQVGQHPHTDGNVDEHQKYDEGLGAAAGINPPADPDNVLPAEDENVV